MPQRLDQSNALSVEGLGAMFADAMRDLQHGRLEPARLAFRACIERDPGHAEAHVHLGEAYRQAGNLIEALAYCDRGLALEPNLGTGRLIRGIVRRDLKYLDGAAEDLRVAVVHFPQAASIHALLGFVLSDINNDGEALLALEAARALDSSTPDVDRTLGDLLQAAGRARDAFDAYQRAIELCPGGAMAYGNLASLVFGMGNFMLSTTLAETAVRLKPDLVEAHCCLGASLRLQGKTNAAMAAYREALTHDPFHVEALSKLGMLKRQACDWDGLERNDEAVRTQSYRQDKRVAPFAILVSTPVPADNLHCARLWAQSLEPTSGERLASYSQRRQTGRLRIGYLSADFHTHATAMLIAEMIELHDRAAFEVYGYSLGPDDGSAMRRRLIASFDEFVDLRSVGHREAALRIHADAIDILIDLKGYTGDARTEIVAYRPAPIQVAFLGYPGTMGAGFIDYIIGDPIVTPTEQQPYYDEKIVHLPRCYQPNDRKRPTAAEWPSRAACGLPEDGFVYCCFNASYKITPEVFDLWVRLLHQVPDSVLWLLESNAAACDNLHREASRRGISNERVVFAPNLPLAQHLARLGVADLFLDTLPINAHTTASEALWVGLPVLTCLGDTFAGRVATSLLMAAGLPELVTATLDAYEASALRLARDPKTLSALRDRLAADRATMPLFDTGRYVKGFEAALQRMADLQAAGRRPEAFSIADPDADNAPASPIHRGQTERVLSNE